ncbi:hypothetical protein K32_20290 [Kaistia sp. 32K]|uniref:hypothetical protein n=1 Tax=Kaistia sp. 32K TaxID=2795690 RepID=UPI0019156F25|nr:hypothetical protein [Kaistia sp. 32K]BCP53412.1 hypothetical protein K32_20290 [Kaistia sp. 32K]
MKRISIALAGLGLLACATTASAQSERIDPVDSSQFRKLSCDEIASRIQALNVPISSNNNSWDELRRNPTLQFILLGIRTPNPTYEDFIAHARGERNALIEVAVAKNCAAQRGLQ